MNLGSKICKDGKPIQNAEEIVENDEVLKLRLFYPWEQKHLIDEYGNVIENFVFISKMTYNYQLCTKQKLKNLT